MDSELDPDPDLLLGKKLDPDPDPHYINAYSQPCVLQTVIVNSFYELTEDPSWIWKLILQELRIDLHKKRESNWKDTILFV